MKPKDFFTKEELERVEKVVQEAEKVTSGEIRAKIISRCRKGFNSDQEVLQQFYEEGLGKTKDQTGVLILIILDSRVIEIRADKGINDKVPLKTWDGVAQRISESFKKKDFCEGLCRAVREIGDYLRIHFSTKPDDVDELPDDVILGE